MEVHEAKYIGSYPNYKLCPKGEQPEYAFIGRSNVGKSSLINSLTKRKELARTSKKPGKTQMLNYFLIDKQWYLVDLPGYGYAKISKQMRQKWRKMIEDFMLERLNLQCAFVLVDSNVSPQKNDIDFINWLGQMQVPFALVFTKIDRLKPIELEENVEEFNTTMLEYWDELPPQFLTSSNTDEGRAALLTFIQDINEQIFSNQS